MSDMDKILQEDPIYTVFIHSIKHNLRFSRHCLENLRGCYRGRTIQCGRTIGLRNHCDCRAVFKDEVTDNVSL